MASDDRDRARDGDGVGEPFHVATSTSTPVCWSSTISAMLGSRVTTHEAGAHCSTVATERLQRDWAA
jgi:hypothetical protein